MQKVTLSVATVAIAALLASAPVSADIIRGGPLKQHGQCWKYSASNEKDARFGSWGACPEAASTATQANPQAAQGQVLRRRPATRSSR